MSDLLVLPDNHSTVKYILGREPGLGDGTFEWLDQPKRLRVKLRWGEQVLSAEYTQSEDHDYRYFADPGNHPPALPRHAFLAQGRQSYTPSMLRLPALAADGFELGDGGHGDMLAVFRPSEKIDCPLLPGSSGSSEVMTVESLAPYSYLSDPFGLAFYDRPIVFGSNIVFSKGLFAWEPLQMQRWTPTDTSLFYDFVEQKAYFSFAGTQRRLDKVGLLLSRCNQEHWFTQNFPALKAFSRLIGNGVVPAQDAILVVKGYSAFERRIFELFGLGQIEVLDVTSPHMDRIELKTAILPTSCIVDHRFAWSSWLGDAFDHLRPEPDPDAPRDIFVRRGEVGSRRGLRNEDALISSLKRAGFDFTPVEAAGHSLDEQRRLFSNARMVIGAYGAGLSSLLWGPRGGVGIELIHDGMMENRRWSYHLLSMAGYRYGVINAKRDRACEPGFEDTMYVEPDMLVDLVRQTMRGF